MQRWIVLLGWMTLLSACGSDEGLGPDAPECALSQSKWEPNVSLVSPGYITPQSGSETNVYESTGVLTGLGQGIVGREITLKIDVNRALGPKGSLTLVAETTGFPSGELIGNAYPVLVSLHDGENEWVNLARTGSSDCGDRGFFNCSGGDCSTASSGCDVTSPSAYFDRTHYDQFNFGSGLGGYASATTFPTCNWSSGSPACAFNSNFFSGGQLNRGMYTAKYVLVASNYQTLSGYTAGIKVTAIRKEDPRSMASSENGSIELNVVLVGPSNIISATTPKGQRNLDALFNQVFDHYRQGGMGVRIASIEAYDWNCAAGDQYADVDVLSLGEFLEKASAKIPKEREGKTINVFIVSSIQYAASNLTVLGISGAIGGPPINGTGKSGVVFSSFNLLEEFNPDCADGEVCKPASQEAQFVDMASTITHELGHYLGLNHLTESDGTESDNIPDTPTCAAGVSGRVSHTSCLTSTCLSACGTYNSKTTYCPDTAECQFNHVMWYTTKNYSEATATGDGNIFSAESAAIVNYSPLVH